MNLEEKLRRSRSTGAIDFSKYQSINQNDPLIKLETTRKILIEPNWTIPDDWEGKRYADYIAKHQSTMAYMFVPGWQQDSRPPRKNLTTSVGL